VGALQKDCEGRLIQYGPHPEEHRKAMRLEGWGPKTQA
jgi:hypothetical protein